GVASAIYESRSCESRVLRKVSSDLAPRSSYRPTSDTAALASGSLSSLLETQVQGLFSQAKGRSRNDCLDQRDGEEQPALGCRKDSGRIIEIGHSCLQAHHSEVHEDGSHTPVTRPDVGNLSAQPRRSSLGMRLLA